MPLILADMKVYLSGGSGNTDPNASIGGAISTTEVSGTALNNLFDNVNPDESLAGDTEYRLFYFKNTNATLTLNTVKAYIVNNTTDNNSAVTLSIGLAAAGLNATETAIANENTAPASVTFSAPTDYAGGLSMGNVPAGQRYGIWVRRVTTAGAETTGTEINATLGIQGVNT